MVIFFAVILLLVVVVFGVSSMMQSYAAAKQAEAVIETAQAAQMATLGNVAIIFLLVIVVLALLGLAVFVFAKRQTPRQTLTPRRFFVRPLTHEIGVEQLPRLPLILTAEDLKLFEEEITLWDAASDEDEEALR